MTDETTPTPRVKSPRFWVLLGAAFLALLLVVVVILLRQGNQQPSSTPAPEPPVSPSVPTASPSPPTTPVGPSALDNGVNMDYDQARTTLKVLPIVKPEPMDGFSADKFPQWLDASTYGWDPEPSDACTADAAAMIRDGHQLDLNQQTCTVFTGTWVDPYTGTTLTDPSKVTVDQVVPLGEAWRSGGKSWDEQQRAIFTNAPLELVTAGKDTVAAKGDQAPQDWLPTLTSARCSYAIRWIAVKSTFGLNLTSTAERDALSGMLDSCDAVPA